MSRRPRFDTEETLAAWWSAKERDVMFHYPTSKSDGHLVHAWFSYARLGRAAQPGEDRGFLDDLEARGYDLTTLRFTIQRKADHPRWAGQKLAKSENEEEPESAK